MFDYLFNNLENSINKLEKLGVKVDRAKLVPIRKGFIFVSYTITYKRKRFYILDKRDFGKGVLYSSEGISNKEVQFNGSMIFDWRREIEELKKITKNVLVVKNYKTKSNRLYCKEIVTSKKVYRLIKRRL